MSGYIPTDDEVETAFMSFVSDLETDFPGSYDEDPEFASIHEAAKGFPPLEDTSPSRRMG